MDGKYIKAAFKIFLFVVIVGLLIQVVSFGIYWYTRRNFNDRDFIKIEKQRCEDIVSESNEDFTDFSYCVRFLQWVKANAPK